MSNSHWQCLCFFCVCVWMFIFSGTAYSEERGVWWPRSNNLSNMSLLKFNLTHFHNIAKIQNLWRIHIICNYWCTNIDVLMKLKYKQYKYPYFLQIFIDSQNKYKPWFMALELTSPKAWWKKLHNINNLQKLSSFIQFIHAIFKLYCWVFTQGNTDLCICAVYLVPYSTSYSLHVKYSYV